MMKTTILGFLLISLAFNSHSGSGKYLIDQMGVMGDHALIKFRGNLTSVPSCADNNLNMASFRIDSDLGKLIYSTALTALAAQKEVFINYSEEADSCALWGKTALLTRLDIKK